ncbi:MAG TPA: hypothetical protein VFQ91_00665 [Bryobacteraceae bacterium]|nr:hypothetical protein [Bryobacteraceae bacterium]
MTMRRSKPYVDAAAHDPVLIELITKKLGIKRFYSLHDVHSVLSEMVHLMTEEEDDQGPEDEQTHWQ